jgi:hypothetical protein
MFSFSFVFQICGTHRTAAQDQKFAQLPAPVRLELLTCRLVLSAFSEHPQVRLNLSPALCKQLPVLACRWLDQARNKITCTSETREDVG